MVRRTVKGVRRREQMVQRTEKGVRRTEKWVRRREIVLWGHRNYESVLLRVYNWERTIYRFTNVVRSQLYKLSLRKTDPYTPRHLPSRNLPPGHILPSTYTSEDIYLLDFKMTHLAHAPRTYFMYCIILQGLNLSVMQVQQSCKIFTLSGVVKSLQHIAIP